MKKGLTFDDPNEKRYKECACGKIAFTKQEALFKKKFLTKEKGREGYLRIYQCSFSNLWHLTKRKDILDIYEPL